MFPSQQSRILSTWRKAVRCTAGASWRDDVNCLTDYLQVTQLSHRFILQFAIAVFRCHNGTAPPSLQSKLSRTAHSYKTRGNTTSYRPFVPRSHPGRLSGSFSNRAPLLWNKLGASLQKSTLSAFKHHLLTLLREDKTTSDNLQQVIFSDTSS